MPRTDSSRSTSVKATATQAAMYLVPVAGPELAPFALRDAPGGLTMGRHGDCELLLPADADRVSRFHARFDGREGAWSITDLGSRWGTSVNGVRLAPQQAVPLAEGDLVRVAPFTFVFSPTPERRGLRARADDAGRGQSIVRTIGGGGTSADQTGVADGLLQLVLGCAEQLHQSTDEQTLAGRLMDAALRGSGLTNAAFLRAVDLSGRFELVASKFSNADAVEFSQSLIAAASTGQPAELSINANIGSHSIAQMNIASALCVPLLIGQGDVDGDGVPDATVAAYLYLDSRGMLAPQMRPQAREFCVALGRIASLALANVKRIEIERRQAKADAELKGAANVQAWMLPKRHTTVGPLACIGESRAGQTIAGDFFDLVDLGDDKVAVTIGDVSGKGVIASVLMTATHGHLHAALREATRDPARAVRTTHDFVLPRKPAGKFVTAWVGVIDSRARTLEYVDAGHGYAILRRADGTCDVLEAGGGPPIGMIDESTYESVTVEWPPGAALLLMSDGIVEQFGTVRKDDGTTAREQFELAGVIRCLERLTGDADPVSCVFEAVYKHGGAPTLSDDATLLWIKS